MSRIIQILENIEFRLEVIQNYLVQEEEKIVPRQHKAKQTQKRAAKGVNERLLLFLCKHPEAKEWPAQRLATSLDCSKTAIIESDVWKKITLRIRTKTKNCSFIEEIADRDR